MRVLQPTTFLLVHGSWQASWSWQTVREHLHAAGHRTLAPTLAGHAPGDNRGAVRFADYEASVLEVLDREPDPRVVLVGHSFGGAVISRIAELRPDRCQRLIYYSGFVPSDGESVADSLPEPFLDTLAKLSAESSDRAVALPYAVFRAAFANTADEATAAALFPRFVPEPYAPIFETLRLPHNHRHGIPTAVLSCGRDLAMPPGLFHPGQSSRLDHPRVIDVDGDHEALLTNPRALATGLLAAVEVESVV
jgi:pimeloyl-ACP methyl ester carboxylesterase